MSRVRVANSEEQYDSLLSEAGAGLVVVDFTAKWCGPCQQIAPIYQQLSEKYPGVMFVKVDVDDVKPVAQKNGIQAMPTFFFIKNKSKVAEMRGANAAQLENMIKQHGSGESSSSSSSSSAQTIPGGYKDLSEYIDRAQLNCLNEDSKHTMKGMVEGKGHLLSDCDEQLLLEVPFNQVVKIHSISISAKESGQGPRNVRLFVNRPKLGFEGIEDMPALQEITMTPEMLEEGHLIPLKFVKFQKVINLQIFVENNQGDEEVTRIDSLKFYGTPELAPNMKDLKKVEAE